MPGRKTSQNSQTHDLNARKTIFDSTQSSASSSNATSQTKKKAAWLEAPLPKFYDQEFAAEMVKQGLFSNLEEAYLEVPENILKNVRERIEDYLLNSHAPIFWPTAPLPSPKK